MQNIPVKTEMGRDIRKVFMADNNCKLVDADYSQVELRVLAHMSGDEHMIDAFKHGYRYSLKNCITNIRCRYKRRYKQTKK